MAVITVDRRTVLDDADTVTNFNQGSQNTIDFAEAIASVSNAVNIGTDQLFWVGTAINFTAPGNELIYIWSSNNATQDGWKEAIIANSAHAVWLSDGTNEIVLLQAGNDRDVFKHADTQVQFQAFLVDIDFLDEKNANGEIFAVTGTFAAFNPAAITEVGAYYVTLSKALAGGFNTFIDAIRYGGVDDGIVIGGGTTGDRGTFLEVVQDDRSKDSGKAFGIIREYTANTYGCQGTITFGNTIGSPVGDDWFEDSNIVLVFEDRDVRDDKFKFAIEGSSDSNNFILSNSSISSAGPAVLVDMSSNGINTLDLNTITFSNLINPILFPTDTLGSPIKTHTVVNCTFDVCGQIDPGTVIFTGHTISNSTGEAIAGSPIVDAGAVLLDIDGSANWADLTFISDGTGHAILVTATGTYDFDNIVYSGYTLGSPPGNEALYNDSGGLVTINILNGGDAPTVRNGIGASTVINNAVTVRVQAVTEGAAVKVLANETVGTLTTGDLIFEKLADLNGVAEIVNFNYEGAFDPSGLDVIVRVRSSGLPTAAIQDDNGVFTDETEEANTVTGSPIPLIHLLPTVPVVNEDRYLFGHAENFNSLKLVINTAGTGGFTITWQYWSGGSPGGWTNLSDVVDDTNSFSIAGKNKVSWTLPGDAVKSTINGQGPFYYVRAAYTAGTVTIVPDATKCTLDVTKYLPFVQNNIITSAGLTVTATWIEDTIATF